MCSPNINIIDQLSYLFIYLFIYLFTYCIFRPINYYYYFTKFQTSVILCLHAIFPVLYMYIPNVAIVNGTIYT